MSTLPSFESILLQVHQSLGCPPYQTTPKRDFASGQKQLSHHIEMADEIFTAIFDALDLDPSARSDIMHNVLDLANFNKNLELNTWTFAADKRQVLWMLLSHSYAPGIARIAAFWNLGMPLDKGMPGGRFWYLPEPREVGGMPSLYLPVAQVVDWLLDLLGMPLEEFVDKRSQRLPDSGDATSESLMRSLYNWRRETTPNTDSLKDYFPDEMEVAFKGVFSLNKNRLPADQFTDALDFVAHKNLTPERLRQEIPMTQAGRLEMILNGAANEDEKADFVECLAERYAAPSPHTIRQRLLFARMVQDGYTRLLKQICPGVDRLCADATQNKLLQLFTLYKLVYNLTIGAWRNCGEQGEDAENAWFEQHLPLADKQGLYLSILPSRRNTAYLELAHLLSRHFFNCQDLAELEDHVGIDAASAMPIIQRIVQRTSSIADELNSELHLVSRLKNSSSWRALQSEHRYWVVSQVAHHTDLSPRAKQAAILRLHELADTPAQTVQTLLLELDGYLNTQGKSQPKGTRERVQALLDKADACEGKQLWNAPLLQYRAKHLLACNDLENAEKLFRQALEAARERNYGRLRGEIARDCLAMAVANQRLIPENHEKYYREMLTGGAIQDGDVPNIEDTARWASDYFWATLYTPYADVERIAPLMRERVKESLRLLMTDDANGLRKWMTCNRSKLNSRMPTVTGDSLLMSWIKGHSLFVKSLPTMRQMLPVELKNDQDKLEVMLERWHQNIGLLAQQAPKQLNLADFKKQTPLMLMTEAGDCALVRLMLQAGADPEMQDYQGMTPLHSAIKSHVDGCVDALLDHPCRLDKLTVDGQSALHTAAWNANLHATRRLLQLAPALAWQRNNQGMTPLERVEYLINTPGALAHLATELKRQGRRCATKDELLQVVDVLEQAAPSAN